MKGIIFKIKQFFNCIKSGQYIPVLVIAISCLLFFSLGVFADKRTILWDAADEYFPTLWYTGHLWREGIVPLWNIFLFNGYPCFADPQNQTFYPINLIIALFTNFSAKIVYLQLVLHYMLAGLFMYLFAGLYIKNTTGRTIAALIYMFNGYMISHFHQLTMINSVVWLPLILYFMEKGWRDRNICYFLPAGISISLLIFAGHPQTMLYMSYAILAFAFFRCFIHEGVNKFTIFPLILFSISFLFGILVASIQLIPSFEFSTLSNRSGPLSYDFASSSGQLSPPYLITLFFPNFFGAVRGPFTGQNTSLFSAYMGVAFIIFLPYSMMKNKKEVFFFGTMALIALLISMGDFGYIFKILFDYLPGFNLFRAPVYFRFIFAFFGALLAGIGIEKISENKFPSKLALYCYWGIIIVLLSFAVSLTDNTNMLHPNRVAGILIFCLTVLFFVLPLHLWKNGKISEKIFFFTLVLLTISDFFIHGFDAKSIENKPSVFMEGITAPLQTVNRQTGISQHVDKNDPFLTFDEIESGIYRIYVDDGLNSHEDRLPLTAYDHLKLGYVAFNRSILNRFFMADGCKPLMLKRYVLFNAILRDKNYENFIKLSNIKYIIKDWSSVEVYKSPLQRAYIVNRVHLSDNIVRDMSRESSLKRTSVNLIKDGGFELGSALNNWETWGDLKAVTKPFPVRKGAHSVQVAANKIAHDFAQKDSEAYLSVLPGEIYYFKGYHIHSGERLGTSGFLIEWTDKSKSNRKYSAFLGDPGTVWTERSGDVRVPDGCYFARILISVRNDMKSGYAYFDDLSFRLQPNISLIEDIAIINMLEDPLFTPENNAVVEGAPDIINQCKNKGNVQILEYLPNKVILETESDCSAFLVLSDTYYPGWKVKIDAGNEIEPLRTNYLFRGVNIPSGKHKIIFEFQPKSFKIGFLITMSALLCGCIIFFIALKRR